jgi:hypothetical protein
VKAAYNRAEAVREMDLLVDPETALAGKGYGEAAAGALERIAAVLKKGEDRTAFLRDAIDREIERREVTDKRKRAPKRT